LANGAGTLLALRPKIVHATHCRNHKLIAHRALAIARFRIALLVRLAKLRRDIILSLPHEHVWTPETRAPDCLNRTVCAIRGWGKNRTVCAIRGCTCLLYNNYTMYSCFWWWYNTIV
jgi:hypothetical protein